MPALSLLLTAALGALVDAQCSFCEDGLPITLPNKRVNLGFLEMTCTEMENYLPIYMPEEDSEDCKMVRRMGTLCGCPRLIPDACELCPDGSEVMNPFLTLPQHDAIFAGMSANCDLMQATMHSVSNEDSYCARMQYELAEPCGCSQESLEFLREMNITSNVTDGNYYNSTINITPIIPIGELDILSANLYGATTEEEVNYQHRIFRVASILSIIGTLLVILDNIIYFPSCDRDSNNILMSSSGIRNSSMNHSGIRTSSMGHGVNHSVKYGRRRTINNIITISTKKLRQRHYNQIVTAMSFSYLILSIATVFMNAPKPAGSKDKFFSEKGAHGTEVTCMIQGLAKQWGSITSLSLNAALSAYYLMIIVYNSKNSRLDQLRKWFLGIPFLLGIVFTCASIPFIESALNGCHIRPPFRSNDYFNNTENGNNLSSQFPFYFLYMVPAFVALAFATVAMGLVACFIHRTEKKSRKWNFSSSLARKGADTIATNNSGHGNTIGQGNENQQRSKTNQSSGTTSTIDGFTTLSQSSTSHLSRKKSSLMPRSKSSLKTKVIYQCALYLLALYMSWIPYLSLTIHISQPRDRHEFNYTLWNFAFFLLPLQGFLNAMVYFRQRVTKRICALVKVDSRSRFNETTRRSYAADTISAVTQTVSKQPYHSDNFITSKSLQASAPLQKLARDDEEKGEFVHNLTTLEVNEEKMEDAELYE